MDENTLFARHKAGLDAASNKIGESRLRLRQNLPPQLFHYTTSTGLLGILNSDRLWATDYRFLNDKSEIEYGMALLAKVIDDRIAKVSSDVVIEALERIRRTANAFDGMFDCYVACFCEGEDLLHQWRYYAASGGGFALGFETKFLASRWGELRRDQDLILTPVIYDPAIQTALIAEVVDAALDALLPCVGDGSDPGYCARMIPECCQFVRAHIADYLIAFKHPAFEIEKEWRLCLVPGDRNDLGVRVRVGEFGLTPYVEADPSPQAGIHANRLPITSLTHGPVPDPENTRRALRLLLSRYPHVNVRGCELPFRLRP